MAERQAQRRFLALKVGEVSLVDSPANEQEFIVLKRCDPEEKIMADVAKNETKVAPDPAAPATTEVTKGADDKAKAEVVPVEVTKSTGDEGAKALAAVEKLTETIAKMVGANAPAPAPTTTDADVEKAKATKMAELRKKLEGAGLTGKALEKAVKAAMEDDGEEMKNTKKAADAEPADGDADIAKTLEVLGAAVQKAKTFTPKRTAALKGAVAELTKLLSELTEVPAGGSPGNSLPSGAQYQTGLADVKKALEDLTGVLKASFDNVGTVTKALTDRVESIEKARNPSQSVTQDGGTDKKVQKSFWAGVL